MCMSFFRPKDATHLKVSFPIQRGTAVSQSLRDFSNWFRLHYTLWHYWYQKKLKCESSEATVTCNKYILIHICTSMLTHVRTLTHQIVSIDNPQERQDLKTSQVFPHSLYHMHTYSRKLTSNKCACVFVYMYVCLFI